MVRVNKMKTMLHKLWLVLMAAGVASAADVAPFYFSAVGNYADGTLTEEQAADLKKQNQAYWEELMKYKIFGAHGIVFKGFGIRIPDTTGWFGTANGNFDMHEANTWHVVGGPVMIGGDIILSNAGNQEKSVDTLVTGPVRVTGDVRMGYSAWYGRIRGTQCIKGSVANEYLNAFDGATLYSDVAGSSVVDVYDKCPESVPNFHTDLTVPDFNYDGSAVHQAIDANNSIELIDVPKGTGPYDYYVERLTFTNTGILCIRMPKGGRLTRIFVQDTIALKGHPKIRVVYMDDDVTWNEGTSSWNAGASLKYENGEYVWSVEHASMIENKDYAGNLLFYTMKSMDVDAIVAEDSIQGTFISSKRIKVEQHMTLAGQLLADTIYINAEFDGSGFIYVPFDPPVVRLPTADGDQRHLREGHPLDTVKIALDKASQLKIDFDYCFEFDVPNTVNGKTYPAAERDDIATTGIPLFDKTTGTCATTKSGTFEIGETEMSAPITLTAKKDAYAEEIPEHFRIWIVNLTAATLEDGSHEGYIDLYIDDDYSPPDFEKYVLNEVLENSKNGLPIDTLRGLHGTDLCVGCVFSIIDANGDPTENAYVEIVDDSIVVVKDSTKLNYEKIHEIAIRVRVEDPFFKHTDSTIVIPVKDVNENPTLAKQTFSFEENSPVGTVVDTAVYGDLDTALAFIDNVFAPEAGDTAYFDISPEGVITTKREFNFEEVAAIYHLVVRVSDRTDPTLYAIDTMVINLLDVNEDPILEDQTFSVDEHKPRNTVVDTVKWDDTDINPSKRIDEFTAVGGDTALFAISSTGIITTKKEFDYETEPHTYTLEVKLTDRNDPTLYVIKTMTITINEVNENPKITSDTIKVKENSEPGTIVDTLEAIDPDDDPLTWTLIEDPSKCFDVSATGVVTTKKCSALDYEKNKNISIKVKVDDGRGGSDIKTIVVNIIDVPTPTIEIPEASNDDSTWHYPEIIYTNKDSLNVCWEVNKKNRTCGDTTLVPGENKICKEVCNVEGFEGCAKDCFTAYYSDVSPVVSIDAGGDANLASNIYTIVEQPAAGDTNVYVKDTVRQITVTITDKDPVKGDSTYSFAIPVDLTKKVDVPQKAYDALSAVAKQTVSLDELNPNTSRTPVNGTSILNSYPTTIAGTEVTVSYVTDTKGNVIKQAVVNEKGKVDSIEVITVSYETEVNGQKVTISYQADAATGKALNVDGNGGFVATKNADSSTGIYKVSYEYTDKKTGNAVELTYVVDKKGNLVKNPEGDRGYQVSFTYVDKYGNAAKQAVFVVLDQTLPTVEILSPIDNQVSHANFVNVEWTVNGEKQDTLTMQGLVKGPNIIVRFYKDKAGNVAADTVRVFMKEGKDLDISVERPVTIVTKDKVDEYYADNPPEKGQTYAVSVKNPTTKEEVETLIGGSFKTKKGSGEKPYANVKSSKHLGPTLILDVTLPTINDGKSGTVSGLATLDDLLLSNGKISSAGIGVDTSKLDAAAKKGYTEYSVDEYVAKYCQDGTKVPSDLSQFNLYNSSVKINIWVYTTLGNFVGKYSFTQELNDPSFANEAGLTQLYFEMKPDKDGYVHAENKKLLATGAYVYKVEAKLLNELRCTLPPLNEGSTTKTKGDVTKSNEELLKPFGYKRPANK